MKTIPNLKFTIKDPDGSTNATTASLLQLCLNVPPQGGLDFATIRTRLRVADVLEKAKPGSDIKLEDSDYATALEAVRAMKWGGVHKDILRFADEFGL